MGITRSSTSRRYIAAKSGKLIISRIMSLGMAMVRGSVIRLAIVFITIVMMVRGSPTYPFTISSAYFLAAGSFITQDNVTAGVRFLAGSPTSQFNVETLWVRNDRVDFREDRYWNLAFGFEQRLINNMWLNLSFGRQLARDASASQFSVISAFNWGLGER